MPSKGDDTESEAPVTTRRTALRLGLSGIVASTIGTTTAAAQEAGTQKWAFETGRYISSSPTVVNGIVYVGSGDGYLYAVDAESGEQEWTYEAGDAIESSPTVVDESLYIGSRDGNLHHIDVLTGQSRWTADIGYAISTSSPTVLDNTIYMGSGRLGGAEGGGLYAVEVDSGEIEWSIETERFVRSSPVVVDNTVYTGTEEGILYAVDTLTGEEEWTIDTGGRIGSSPTIVDGTIYIGTRGDPSGVVDEGTVPGSFLAVDADSGDVQWTFTIPFGTVSSPTVLNNNIYVGADDSKLYALNKESGNEKWVFEIPDTIVQSSPTVVNDTIYVGADESLYAVDAVAGEKEWVLDFDSSINFSSPTVVNGTVYIGTQDGNLHAIDTGTLNSSQGSRVLLGTLGHHDELRIGESLSFGATGQDSNDELLLLGGGLIGATAVGAYLVRRERKSSEQPQGEKSNLTNGGSASNTTETKTQSTTVVDEITTENESTTGRDQAANQELPSSSSIPETIPSHESQSVEYTEIDKGDSIGRGGSADVYYATAATGSGAVELALKEPRMSGTLHTDAIDQMLEEAETWQQLDDHDHIVSVVDYGSDPLPWIAMEYMDAGHLGERAGTFDIEQALWTAIATTKAVRHAHRRGVAHLDLKPANVLFRSVDDAWDVPKVADWGLSKQLLDHSKSVEGISPHYAAPEQFDEDFGSADDVTDIYQLGTVFYELFTGRPPFEGQTYSVMDKIKNEDPIPPSDIVDIPPELDDILLTALAKDKADRYETVVYLRDELQELWDEHH